MTSPRNGAPLTMGGIALTVQGGALLETISDLVGDKTRSRIRAARRPWWQPPRTRRVLLVSMHGQMEVGVMMTLMQQRQRLAHLRLFCLSLHQAILNRYTTNSVAKIFLWLIPYLRDGRHCLLRLLNGLCPSTRLETNHKCDQYLIAMSCQIYWIHWAAR
jgi:hypothetical protein